MRTHAFIGASLALLFGSLYAGDGKSESARAVAPVVLPDPLYEHRVEHDPNGIGVFYFGREIAHVMGHQAAGWLERPDREQEERTDLLVEALGLKEGGHVADIGAGSGYFCWRMAGRVGGSGRVYGVDIQPEMLDILTRNISG